MSTQQVFYREDILKRARECLDFMRSCRDADNLSRAVEYHSKAKAYIELVEVGDCGHIGGFDVDQEQEHRVTLGARLQWLERKT